MKSAYKTQDFQLGVQDPFNLTDPVWTTLHLAMFLDIREDAVLSLVHSFGFPKPLANQKRNRRWLAEDVKAFFVKRSQGQIESLNSYQPDKSQMPKSMRLKG
jgi:hypothetical protein